MQKPNDREQDTRRRGLSAVMELADQASESGMNTPALVEQYRRAAIAHYQATLDMRSEDTIQSANSLTQAQEALMRAPSWRMDMQRLLRDSDRRVRLDAACVLLKGGSCRAWLVLWCFALISRDALGLIARMRLHVWKNERR